MRVMKIELTRDNVVSLNNGEVVRYFNPFGGDSATISIKEKMPKDKVWQLKQKK